MRVPRRAAGPISVPPIFSSKRTGEEEKKSNDQRKPSGCAITRPFPSKMKSHVQGWRATGQTKTREMATNRLRITDEVLLVRET